MILMAHDPVIMRHRSQPGLSQKLCKDPATNKTAQPMVTCVYQAHIAGFWHNVTALWGKNLMNYSLSISIDSVENYDAYTCKIDLKPWHFWTKKGYKTFPDVDGKHVDIYWDLRSAKFSSSPEPCSNYYIALVSDNQVVLLIGDLKKKAYKRTKASPTLVDAILFYKKENIFGKKTFTTRAKFDDRKQEHDIVVESSMSCPGHPEMWISIDGVVAIHIKNLQWKFRGNEMVVVDKQPVHVFWDVHAWLFCALGTSYGLFIFKSGKEDVDCGNENEDSNGVKGSRFCFFLCVWKVE